MGWVCHNNKACKECTESSVRGFLRMAAVVRSRRTRKYSYEYNIELSLTEVNLWMEMFQE
jgi:hypothetical protein